MNANKGGTDSAHIDAARYAASYVAPSLPEWRDVTIETTDFRRGRRDAIASRVSRREYAKPGTYREGVRSWTM